MGKKYKTLFYILLLLAGFSATTFAAFSSIKISTIQAEAIVTGGELAMSIEIRNISDHAQVSSVTWHVTVGSSWRLANQYILLHSTLTQAGGGIRIYTDNKASDANPRYGGTFDTDKGAGLISTSTNTVFLPMAWLISDSSTTPTPADPNSAPNWFYFKDKEQPDFWSTDKKDYSIVKKAEFGIHYAQGQQNYALVPSPDYIYLEADFTKAVGGTTYRTTTLRIELYSE